MLFDDGLLTSEFAELLLLSVATLLLLFFLGEFEVALSDFPQPAVSINAIQIQIAEIILFFITTPHLFF